MTPNQMAQALQHAIRARKWEGDATYQSVFYTSSVRVTPMVIDSWLATKPFPLCIIGIGAATHDPQTPGLIDQTFEVILATGVTGDEIGENSLIGGGRPVAIGQAGSGGRGLLEIESEFLQAVQLITQEQGVQIQAQATSIATVQEVAGLGFVASRQYAVKAICTSERTYLGVTALAASGATGGTISLTWAAAPTQWMTFAGAAGQVVRWASGSTPPATRTAGSGTGVSAVTGVSTSATITGLSSGTYSVSVFSAYNETGAAAPDRWSDPVSVTVVVP